MADALTDAFMSEVETEIPDDQLPRSQQEAERVRDEAFKSIAAARAWKLGATIAIVRKGLGLSRAFFGPIPASCVFEDGAELRGFHTRLRGVESEYGFELARDVQPDDLECDDDDFGGLFACVRPAIEIPGTRYRSLGQYGGLALVADFGAVGGLVIGPARPVVDVVRINKGAVRLFFSQRQVAAGSAEGIEGGAMAPLRVFLRQATQAGYALRAGQTIVTGSCTGYVQAPLNEPIRVTFDALDASVSMTFVDGK